MNIVSHCDPLFPNKKKYLDFLALGIEGPEGFDETMKKSSTNTSGITNIGSLSIKGMNRLIATMPEHPILNIGCQRRE